jgi:hypothetical protein
MNAEYQSHKQTHQMLEPRMDAHPGTSGVLVWTHPLALAASLESLTWLMAAMDPATVAHGVRELASPLSE